MTATTGPSSSWSNSIGVSKDSQHVDQAWNFLSWMLYDAAQVEVVAKGGLYVLGTERHESRRIDNQLRGRSGRQGDPGASRFFLSLEDDLMRLFATGALNFVMGRALPDDEAIEAKMVTKAIEKAQALPEASSRVVQNFVTFAQGTKRGLA